MQYKFSDLVDIQRLQKLLNSFYEATGIPHGIHDVDGNILSGAGWQDICTKFHRVCPQIEYKCKISDSYISEHLHEGPFIGYKCLNGLMDYGTPIIVEGQHLATMCLGQFLHEPPDEEFFRRQARENGFGETDYIEALRRVPIIPKERAESIMIFFSQLAQFLAMLGLEKKGQLESADRALKLFMQQKALLDSIPDIAWLKDRESRFIAVNQPYGQACGVEPDNLVGKTDLHIWPKKLAEGYMANDRQVVDSGRMKRVEELLVDRRGYQFLLETIKVPILDENWSVIGTAGISRDITERKKLEDELRRHRDHLEELVKERTKDLETANLGLQKEILNRRRAEEALEAERLRLFSLLESMPATICLIAPDYSLVFANKRIRENFGEIKGRSCYKIFNQREVPCTDCPIQIVMKTNTAKRRKCIVLGDKIYQSYYYPFYDIDGSLLVLGLGIDITEQKRLGKEIARLDRLNLVGEMAAGIGHEIRNPMTTVRGFLQMLREKDDCARYKDYFNLMIEELDRANSIISEYLSLAKNKPVELKMQSLNRIISVILPLITADALVTDKNIEIKLADIPELFLDEKEIRQLLLNLVRNGLEAMPPGGRLTIKTSADNGEVILAIQDCGKGIDSTVLEKIGTPFCTTKENGTGLGLAVCYSIASRHNATINVETSTGGTTFYVRFKVKQIEELLCKQITRQTQHR
ncbi:MAG: PocR ligand-binding domain-containing protein [Desulfotomaculaceae bacterium]|nr:PocR ligand-binding domain-containing protein [Desulfotomaculaceae bacterium]